MHTLFINDEIRKICEHQEYAKLILGKKIMEELTIRLEQIEASSNLTILETVPGARCHELVRERAGEWSINLGKKPRLIFLPVWVDDEKSIFKVEKIKITEIGVNTHKKNDKNK